MLTLLLLEQQRPAPYVGARNAASSCTPGPLSASALAEKNSARPTARIICAASRRSAWKCVQACLADPVRLPARGMRADMSADACAERVWGFARQIQRRRQRDQSRYIWWRPAAGVAQGRRERPERSWPVQLCHKNGEGGLRSCGPYSYGIKRARTASEVMACTVMA